MRRNAPLSQEYVFSLLYNTNNLIAIQHCEITELNALKEPLIDILAEAIYDMRPHLIDSEGLKLFAFVWEPVNSTVNDHEEQLRVELKPIRPARQTRAKRV